MPRWWSIRLSNPAFGSRNPKAPFSRRSKAELSSTRNASKETSFFSEPADQHPFLTVTAVSVRNRIFPASAYYRSGHKGWIEDTTHIARTKIVMKDTAKVTFHLP